MLNTKKNKIPIRLAVIIAAKRTFRVIHIVHLLATRATHLSDPILRLFFFRLKGEKLHLAAAGTAIHGKPHRTGKQVGHIAKQPACLTKLKVFSAERLHGLPTAQAF